MTKNYGTIRSKQMPSRQLTPKRSTRHRPTSNTSKRKRSTEKAKKKKSKAPDFDKDVSIPNHLVLRPHPFTVNKLRLFEYVELWYFT